MKNRSLGLSSPANTRSWSRACERASASTSAAASVPVATLLLVALVLIVLSCHTLVWIESADSTCEAIARDARARAHDECAPLALWRPVGGRTVRSH